MPFIGSRNERHKRLEAGNYGVMMMDEYKSMFEQAIRTLAAIDEALGIGDDGCGDPEQTLYAIEELKAEARRGVELARAVMADNVGKS